MTATIPAGGPSLTGVIERFRADTDAGRQAASRAVLGVYGEGWQQISADLAHFLRLRTVTPPGEQSPSWTYNIARLTTMRAELEADMRALSAQASVPIDAGVQAGAAAGAQAGEAAVFLAAPGGVSFAPAPTGALRQLAAAWTAPGSPLVELLATMPTEQAQALSQGIVRGMAAGHSPQRIIRDTRSVYAGQAARTARIARTEYMRAYRGSTLETYRANEDVVVGWMWVAALQLRTCASCFAMHGRVFPLTATLDDHPNGRCAMVPVTAEDATGLGDVPTGEREFAGLTARERRQVLGPTRSTMYESGDYELLDFVHETQNRRWGPMKHEATIGQVDANRAARLAGRVRGNLGEVL